MEKKQKAKLRSVPVYLPEEKHEALDNMSTEQRIPKTRLIEMAIDKFLKKKGQ